MSDLGAIFHVKKDGVQYDAHAYTTTDECPEPNLKLMFKGQQAYVKLEAKGSGDVPCYVKASDGTYQVKTEAVPTGGYDMSFYENYTLVVPAGVKVIRVQSSDTDGGATYVGVTPNSTHTLHAGRTGWSPCYVKCTSHDNNTWATGDGRRKLRWSPEINKETPTRTDY